MFGLSQFEYLGLVTILLFEFCQNFNYQIFFLIKKQKKVTKYFFVTTVAYVDVDVDVDM